jgi:transcriptional regulator with XRE-family HTH domain
MNIKNFIPNNVALQSDEEIAFLLCSKIVLIRVENNLTQQDLSKLSGVSYGKIRRMEQEGYINLIDLVKILRVLGKEDIFTDMFNFGNTDEKRMFLNDKESEIKSYKRANKMRFK